MWILATRARPHNLRRFFEAFAATGATAPGVVCVDDNDPFLAEYLSISLPDGWIMEVAPQISCGPAYNRAFEGHRNEPWYGFITDDAMPLTHGWEQALVEAAGSDAISYCADGIRDEKMPSQWVIGGDLTRELGWICLPGVKRVYADDAIAWLGRSRGILRYVPDHRLEHWHFCNGKAPMDETYRKPDPESDRQIFYKWRATQGLVVFVCVKAGKAYGPEYVNLLRDMVARNLPDGYPGRFVCLTDDPEGLDEGVETMPLPADLEKWWGKLYMFKRGLFPDRSRMIFFDLDTLITGPLDDIVGYSGQFATLRDFYFPDRLGPAVIMWEAGEFAASIWDEWVAQGKPRHPMGDLWWLNNLDQGRFPRRVDKLQDVFPGAFVSFKADCQPEPPKSARVVCFHGQPKPSNCDTKWVADVWKIDGATIADIKVEPNTEYGTAVANVRSSIARDLPWLSERAPHAGHAVIVGGGPSVAANLEEIARRQREGQTIFAGGGAARYLMKNGILPDCQVLLDARADNAQLILPEARRHLVCSQCDPGVFDRLVGRNVTLYHANSVATERTLRGGRPAYLISTGSTVSLITMGIVYVEGYRFMHLFGMDSSYTADRHAYEQKLNDEDRVVEAVVGGRAFKCAPWMVAQAEQFQIVARELAEADCVITVAGDGLLPHIARIMSEQSQEAA